MHYPALSGYLLETEPPLKNLVIKLYSEPEIFAPEEWPIDEIRPGQAISLQKRPLNVPHGLLFNLTEELKVSITLSVITIDKPKEDITTEDSSMDVLSAIFGGG